MVNSSPNTLRLELTITQYFMFSVHSLSCDLTTCRQHFGYLVRDLGHKIFDNGVFLESSS